MFGGIRGSRTFGLFVLMYFCVVLVYVSCVEKPEERRADLSLGLSVPYLTGTYHIRAPAHLGRYVTSRYVRLRPVKPLILVAE